MVAAARCVATNENDDPLSSRTMRFFAETGIQIPSSREVNVLRVVFKHSGIRVPVRGDRENLLEHRLSFSSPCFHLPHCASANEKAVLDRPRTSAQSVSIPMQVQAQIIDSNQWRRTQEVRILERSSIMGNAVQYIRVG